MKTRFYYKSKKETEMKNLHTCVSILSLIFLLSCSNRDKRTNQVDEKSTDETLISALADAESNITAQTDEIITTYLYMKDALVNEDSATAAAAGSDLIKQLKSYKIDSYDNENQSNLQKLIDEATLHAQYIAENSIAIQREHFDILSKNMIDLIEITGTTKKLYVAYCPMYNNDKGAQWLSDSEEIKNPYYGSAMLTCGEIQREIN